MFVCDPKGMLGIPEWNLEPPSRNALRRFRDGYAARIRWPVPDSGNWEPIFEEAYRIGNVVVYIDEVYGVVDIGKKPGTYLMACYTRGRERGIGMVAATQRPTWVPLVIFSEAEWFFVFQLLLPDDRRRVAGFVGEQVEQRITDKHGFWTYNTAWNTPIYTDRFRPRQDSVERKAS